MAANVWLVGFVHAQHVLFQVRQLGKGDVLTQQTSERFFPGVTPRVQLQSRRMRKRFPANLAAIGLLSTVHPLVHRQLRSLRKGRTAVRASVRFVILVRPHVLRQVTLQLFIANLAMESLYVRVKTV